MKAHIILTTLGSLMVSALLAHGQETNAPADATAESQPTTAIKAPAIPAPDIQVADASGAQTQAAAQPQAADTTNTEVTPAEGQPAPEAQPATDTTSGTQPEAASEMPAVPAPEVQVADATETPSAADTAMDPASTNTESAAATEAEPTSTSETNSPADTVIPLIVIDDTPLLDAIRNLARQADINLIIDPKVAYGQPTPDGKGVNPQPNVTIRWENITAEQALGALLNNYGLQAVEDPRVKITRITVKDPAAPDPLVTKTIQLQYASPTNLMSAVTAALTDKRSKVVADIRTSQLVVVATEKEQDTIEKLVAKLDAKTKQVLIESRLVETSMNPSTIKGIDWTGTLKGQNVAFGNNNQNGPVDQDSTLPPLSSLYPKMIMEGASFNPATAFLNADGVSAVLSFLNNNTESKILSSPRTVTLDNDTAHIEVGTEYPIVNVTAGTANTTGGSSISYSNLTVRLDVTPRISANDTINLKVTPQVMRLESVQKFEVGGQPYDVPIFAKRLIDTSVMIPSGNTLVMGGLIQDNINKSNVKVPLLGDIPGLGLLFRQDKKDRTKQNLIVFITPTIVQDEDFQPTKSDYLKTPMPPENAGEPDWTAWDSGAPFDWSKHDGSTVQ